MGIVRKLRDGARWIENVVEFEAPRPDPEPEPTPKPKPKPKPKPEAKTKPEAPEKPERADMADRAGELLGRMFKAWVDDINSIPFHRNTSAPEATR
ncbi:hypothetical protein ACFORO_12270 [Amycolatopsis halotolerans]|uniref:Uncharacterized protein n=1 Tax=Amycolatopsis halotolerans TaxID=330083 RepID=A0ABV7QCD3_9PSEU